MKKFALIALVACLSACSAPTDIVFGPEPLKQMAEQGDKFKQLPEEDRMLLAGYLTLRGIGEAFGAKDLKPVAGRTVGEVLVEARDWKAKVQAQEAAAKKKEAEATALKAKVLAERKAVADKLSAVLTVAVIAKTVSAEDFMKGRAFAELELNYAVENKSEKAIRQIKGTLAVFDATGDKVGELPLTFDDKIDAHATIKTDTGSVWRITGFTRGDIERIAETPFDGMTTRFEVEALAYADGEVVKAPSLPDSD
jgi:hypothetical protein